MKHICFEENELLDRTDYTQAALVTTCMAMTKEIMARGLTPDMTAGLSLGEYCAITTAGGMELEDAIKMVWLRGNLMHNAVPDGKGGMAAVLGLSGEAVKFPIDPMIGVIGTAPDGEDVIDGFVGAHGGNLDNKLITKGTRMYFPVRVPGALLQMGDVHATMGDAELCGTGIEIAAEITVKVSLVKDFELNWPVLETFGPHGKWYVNASAQEFDEALMNVSKEMQRLLMRITGWDAVDTYMYMS